MSPENMCTQKNTGAARLRLPPHRTWTTFDQVVGSVVHGSEVAPKLATELLQVQPVYQALFSAHTAPIRNGVGAAVKNETGR